MNARLLHTAAIVLGVLALMLLVVCAACTFAAIWTTDSDFSARLVGTAFWAFVLAMVCGFPIPPLIWEAKDAP
jgi:cell shape-determining protein MreD